MKKIRCVAIGDEPIALSIIEEYCSRRGDIDITTFCDPDEGYAEIMKIKPDVVLIDISLGGVSGIDMAKMIPENTCLIFTTAYVEYAKDVFDMDAVDYLQKPFSCERFDKVIERAKL